MRKPVVDYRTFRLNRIHEPEFAHLKLLLGWVVYIAMFFLTERLIPLENCYPVHCFLDDLIPFCEVFLIPYVFWYFLIIISLGYFLLYNVENFKRLQIFLTVCQLVAMVIYMLLPSRQDLRPVEFPRDNFLTQGVAVLYTVDTNTCVCPSMHVAFSIGMASVWLKEKSVSLAWRISVVVIAAVICLSTVFLKQHSVVDFFAALPLCLLAEWIACGKNYWLPRLRRQAMQK